jgi:hypothetical protein
MRTLNTIQEVLHALADGETLRQYDNSLLVFDVEELVYIGRSGALEPVDFELPCTIKEEPEYLWECMYCDSHGRKWFLLGGLKTQQQITDDIRGLIKLRKFQMVNHAPMEVK